MSQLTLYGLTPKKRSNIIESGAIFSEDRMHRYMLYRTWNKRLPTIMFIGLNPSRADETYNDPTITRCKNFAESWGYGSMHFLNLYSFISPYVYKVPPGKEAKKYLPLRQHLHHGVGDKYDINFLRSAAASDRIVCCWGSWPFTKQREQYVLSMIKEPWCFGVNKNGSPKHPLYLSSETKLIKYEP